MFYYTERYLEIVFICRYTYYKSIAHCVCWTGCDYSTWYFQLAKQTRAILYTFRNECCWDQHCRRKKNKHFSFTTAYVFSSPFHGSQSCLKREGECGWSYNFFMVHFPLLSSPKSLPKARLNSDITTQTHSHTCSILYTCTCRGVLTAMRACYSFFKPLFRGW